MYNEGAVLLFAFLFCALLWTLLWSTFRIYDELPQHDSRRMPMTIAGIFGCLVFAGLAIMTAVTK